MIPVLLIVLVACIGSLDALNISTPSLLSKAPQLGDNDDVVGFQYGGGKIWLITDQGTMNTYDIASKTWSAVNFTNVDKSGMQERFFSVGKRLFRIMLPETVNDVQKVTLTIYFWDDAAGQFTSLPLVTSPQLNLAPTGNGFLSVAVSTPDHDDGQNAYLYTGITSASPYGTISKLDILFTDGVPTSVTIQPVASLTFPEQLFIPYMAVMDNTLYAFVKNGSDTLKANSVYTIDLQSGKTGSTTLTGFDRDDVYPWDDQAYVFQDQMLTMGNTLRNYRDRGVWWLDLKNAQWKWIAALPNWEGGLGYTVDVENRVLYLINLDQGLFAYGISV